MANRKFIFITALLQVLALSSISLAQEKEINLFPVTENEKCGYIDRTGKIVIPLKFEQYCLNFSEGLASVGLNGKRGFIDETGRFVIEPKFDSFPEGSFDDGLAVITMNGTNGYVDKSGKVTLLPEYSSVESFNDGLAVVGRGGYSNGLYGYIDKQFKVVIPVKYKYASPFSDERAYVSESSRSTDQFSYYINRAGQKMNYPPNGGWFLFVEGLATTDLNGKVGYMNLEGKIVIKPRFDEARRFSHGMAAVRIKNKWGFIDRTGRIVIRPQFDEVDDFGPDGIAAVARYDKNLETIHGFVNRKGQMIIGFKFDYASSFWDGLAQIGTRDSKGNDKWGYIDKSGKIIWQPSK